MSTILDEIVARKRHDLAERREQVSLPELLEQAQALPPARGFAKALAAKAPDGPAVIAEVKRGSPSLGCIRPEMDAPAQAAAYEQGGAAALSVLTDEPYFFARDNDFSQVRERVGLPMLRKDFIVDELQVAESRLMGGDCILLIMAVLSDREAAQLAELAHQLGMDVLAETHNTDEIRRAVDAVPYDLIGVNNRNLKTFETRVETTLELAEAIPDWDQLVAESGLHEPETLARYWRSGIRRFLVGEAFVRADDPVAKVRSFATATGSFTPSRDT